MDIILKDKELLPIEVKYGTPNLTSMLKFLEEFSLHKAIILTKNTFDKKIINRKEIKLIPLWAFSISKRFKTMMPLL